MRRLNDMKQYHITRERFMQLIEEHNFTYSLQDYCEEHVTTDSFTMFRIEDEYYIIHLPSGMMINWYKHYGRTNTCSQYWRTDVDYEEFFSLLSEELKEF